MNTNQEIKEINRCIYDTENNASHPFNNILHPEHAACADAVQQLKDRKSELVMQRANDVFNQ